VQPTPVCNLLPQQMQPVAFAAVLSPQFPQPQCGQPEAMQNPAQSRKPLPLRLKRTLVLSTERIPVGPSECSGAVALPESSATKFSPAHFSEGDRKVATFLSFGESTTVSLECSGVVAPPASIAPMQTKSKSRQRSARGMLLDIVLARDCSKLGTS